MVSGASVQNTVSNILTRADLKRAVVIEHYNVVENSYGDDEFVFDSQETAYGIPLNYTKLKKKYDIGGLYEGSSLILLLPYDATISKNDIVTIYNTDYTVSGIDKSNIGEYIIHNIVFLLEKVDD